jgi:hypothetical protein
VTDARTNVRAFAIIGVANERAGGPDAWIVVKKVVYTRDAAVESVEKLNAKADGRTYFWQQTALEPLS